MNAVKREAIIYNESRQGITKTGSGIGKRKKTGTETGKRGKKDKKNVD
jgi:hypothetical protein